MKPLFVLVGAFLTCLFITRFSEGYYLHFLSGTIAMSAMLGFTGLGHFLYPKGMAMMVPDFIPFKKAVVYLTGVMEILFAVGLLFASTRQLTGWALIAFFVIVFPANLHAARLNIDYQKADANGPGLKYLWFRVPLQIFFIIWVWFFTVNA